VQRLIKTKSQVPRCENAGLSSDRNWITYNSKNVLWLPSEYLLVSWRDSKAQIEAFYES
jgi:hypothetical protein